MENEAKEAIKRVDKIIQEWEENRIEAYEALELLVLDLKTIICYFEMIQVKINEVCYKKRES